MVWVLVTAQANHSRVNHERMKCGEEIQVRGSRNENEIRGFGALRRSALQLHSPPAGSRRPPHLLALTAPVTARPPSMSATLRGGSSPRSPSEAGPVAGSPSAGTPASGCAPGAVGAAAVTAGACCTCAYGSFAVLALLWPCACLLDVAGWVTVRERAKEYTAARRTSPPLTCCRPWRPPAWGTTP